MDDVGKIRYLIIERTGGRKLKRPVPKDVQHLAGQKNFVRRIRASSASAIKSAANLFAVATDAEIDRLRRLMKSDSNSRPTGTRLTLNDRQVETIARAYFAEHDRRNLISGLYVPPADATDLADLLSDASNEAEEALREHSGEFRTSPIRAVRVLQEQGIISDQLAHSLIKNGWPYELESHQPFQYLCRLLEQADLSLAERKFASLNRGSLVEVNNAFFASAGHAFEPSNRGREGTKTVADLKTLFLKSKKDSTGRSRQEQFKLPFRFLEEQLGPDELLINVDRETARSLLSLLPRIPAHATKRYRALPLSEAADAFEQTYGKSAERYNEAEKHLRVLSAAFRLAVEDGIIASNPFQGLKVVVPRAQLKKHVTTQQTYQPYSVEQLNKLFALPLFTGCENDERGCHRPGPNLVRRHRYWTPIIALWTGMRMNEILQLEKADFASSEEGIPFIQVTDQDHQDYSADGFSKRLKSKNSLRNVPVHPSLVELGLLNWVADAPDGRLFPEASNGTGEKPSDLFSKRFRSNAMQAGIWAARRYVFHSFRNTFNDALRAADVPLDHREAIQGWREQRTVDQSYGAGHTIKKLYASVSAVSYPGLRIGSHTF